MAAQSASDQQARQQGGPPLVLLATISRVLLPIARFPGLIWLVVAGLRLPHRRPSHHPHAHPERISS